MRNHDQLRQHETNNDASETLVRTAETGGAIQAMCSVLAWQTAPDGTQSGRANNGSRTQGENLALLQEPGGLDVDMAANQSQSQCTLFSSWLKGAPRSQSYFFPLVSHWHHDIPQPLTGSRPKMGRRRDCASSGDPGLRLAGTLHPSPVFPLDTARPLRREAKAIAGTDAHAYKRRSFPRTVICVPLSPTTGNRRLDALFPSGDHILSLPLIYPTLVDLCKV